MTNGPGKIIKMQLVQQPLIPTHLSHDQPLSHCCQIEGGASCILVIDKVCNCWQFTCYCFSLSVGYCSCNDLEDSYYSGVCFETPQSLQNALIRDKTNLHHSRKACRVYTISPLLKISLRMCYIPHSLHQTRLLLIVWWRLAHQTRLAIHVLV